MTGKDDGADWIRGRLPRFERFFCRTEADYYGVGWEVAGRLGLKHVPYSGVAWTHGWPFAKLKYARQLVTYAEPSSRYLVPKVEHEEFLGEHGFPNGTAVGLPICYARCPEVERRPNTLLVMPAHTTHVHVARRWDEEGYAERIAGLRDRFDSIVACVHSSCYRSGIWVNAFRKVGIPCLSGARTNDRNALRAQRTLFRSFEFVTGNQMGSFVAYASYLGAKVSIWGGLAEYTEEDYATDQYMKANPGVLANFLECCQPGYIEEFYPWLLCEPEAAVEKVEWGRLECGGDRVLPDAGLAEVLGWNDVEEQRRYRTKVLPKVLAAKVRFYSRHGLRILCRRLRGRLGRPGGVDA